MTGISAITKNFATRLRTKSTLYKFVSFTKDMASTSQKVDAKEDLKPSRIRRDNRDLERILDQIRLSCNPFKEETSQKLFNIHTGKATNDEVRQSLLKVQENEKTLHQQFIEECKTDAHHFEHPIKKLL